MTDNTSLDTQEKFQKTTPVSSGNRVLPLLPTNMDELLRMANLLAQSGFLPKSYQQGTRDQLTAKVCAAIQMGAELGLPPLQAIQNIAVINGKPSIYGDAMLALVRSSNKMVYFKECFDGAWGQAEYAAVCVTQRAGETEEERTEERFTMADAKTAGLWGKAGPWSTHPKRMLKYKARAFALRDKYSDVLGGLHMQEELEGENFTNATPAQETTITPFDRFKQKDITPPPTAEPQEPAITTEAGTQQAQE